MLQAGEVVAIPTETVYGLAANALNPEAVAQVFRIKNRPHFDPLIVHIASWNQAEQYIDDIPDEAHRLAEAFMPGPLTLLLPRKSIIPDLVTSGSDRVAIRIPLHPVAQQLLQQLPFPLAAPSANPFGYISPTTAAHVAQQLGDVVPYILDGGAAHIGVESTIVGWEAGQCTVYRKGALGIEAIEAVVGKVVVQGHSSSNPQARGMLASHYAPRVPFELGDIPHLLGNHEDKRAGVLVFQKIPTEATHCPSRILSERGDLAEAAQRLFACMRELDSLQLDIILGEEVPDTGLGRAINDRLRRAAAR